MLCNIAVLSSVLCIGYCVLKGRFTDRARDESKVIMGVGMREEAV